MNILDLENNIIYKNKKNIIIDNTAIVLLNKKYEYINNFYKSKLFKLLNIQGYILNDNIINYFEDNPNYNNYFKKILYPHRYKTQKPINDMLKSAKKDIDKIKKISINIPDKSFKNISFINNTGLYNEVFINEFNKIDNITLLKKLEIFGDYLTEYIYKLEYEEYNNIIFIPIKDWISNPDDDLDYKINMNPLSFIVYSIKKNKNKIFLDKDIVLYNKDSLIKFNLHEMNKNDKLKLLKNIYKLSGSVTIPTIDDEPEVVNNDSLKSVDNNNNKDDNILDLKVDNIEDLSSELLKLDMLKNNEEDELTDKQKKYIEENTKKVRDLKINNKKISDIVDNKNDNEVENVSLNIDSINDIWENLTYVTADKVYDLDADIVKIFYFYGEINKANLILTNLTVEDTSTSYDAKNTWTATYRNMKTATTFDVKVDMPKIIDNKFMFLGGNNKYLGKQLFRIPLSKSNKFEVQMVSNYNKIFIKPNTDEFRNRTSREVYKLSKVLLNNELKNIKVIKGNNLIANANFDMDIERYDLSQNITEIKYKSYSIKFNMKDLNNKHDKIIGYNGKEEITFENGSPIDAIIKILSEDTEFKMYYNQVKDSSNYVFSKARMMSENLPIMYVVCYYNGLIKGLEIAGIEYEIVNKNDRDPEYRYLKTSDFIIKYKNTARNSMLMSGLKYAGIEMFELAELENKNTYIDMLDIMGISRIKADGIDNFKDLFLDPITAEVCEHYNLPTDFSKLLIMASDLLLDTKYLEHSDMKSYRLRSNEQLAGYLFYGLSDEYSKFSLSMKKTKKGKIFIKRNKIINLIMQDKMFSDTSDINDLHSIEMSQQVSVKGLKGMNEERSFNLDKRSYDKSMNGILTGSTPFAGNVGMDRQIALNTQISSSRGYLDTVNKIENSELSIKDMSITDSMIALSATSDDPFRQLMGNVQRNKHTLNVTHSSPPLITSGTEMALPYLTRNLFSYNAKEDGKVLEINDKYILIEYNNGEKDYIDMTPQAIKDSGGGMHLELNYDTKLKPGQKFKKNDVLTYDKTSYSVNSEGQIAYNFGTLAKVALLNTEEGFEDSSRVSFRLSNKMESIIIKIKDITINKKSVIYFAAQKGDYIKEGDPLLIYQNPFSESETNELLKKLNNTDNSIVNELGRIIIKSKATGYIQDIKAYRTVEMDEMSDSVKKYFNAFNKDHKEKLNIINKNNIKDKSLKYNFMEKQELTGKLKNAFDSVLFEYQIRTTNKFSNGDKLVLYTANKGVDYAFFPEGLEPTSEYRPDEIIDTFGTLSAINKRKVTSVSKVALINKGLIELTRQCRDMLGIKYDINDI